MDHLVDRSEVQMVVQMVVLKVDRSEVLKVGRSEVQMVVLKVGRSEVRMMVLTGGLMAQAEEEVV